MHYYQFNIGNYRKDTSHLSLLEHGIYRMLLDSYYTNEGPLPADDAKLMRTHCIRTAEEQAAYKSVVADFFELRDGVYIHDGCQKVMGKIYEKSSKAREAAEKRWANKRAALKADECSDDANALQTDSERNANGMLPINLLPITQSKPSSAPKAPPCKTQEVIEIFARRCPSLVQPKVIPDAVKGMIADRWRQDPKHQTLEFWEKYFGYCESLDFLSGRATPTRGEKPFRVGLEWVVKSGNFAKIINGNYANG